MDTISPARRNLALQSQQICTELHRQRPLLIELDSQATLADVKRLSYEEGLVYYYVYLAACFGTNSLFVC